MKKQMILRLLCLALTTLMLLSALACGKSNGETTTTTSNSNGTTSGDSPDTQPTQRVDANGYLLDDLDPDLNFKGTEFTLLYWSDREHEEFYVEHQTGDLINDAIYNRNQAVEERLGIKYNYVSTPGNGNSSNVANFTQVVNTSIAAGDHSYDLIGGYSCTIGSCAAKGLLYNLNELDDIDFEKPWWPDKLIQQASINDKLYFVSGDISANVIYMMYVTFFNKDLLAQYQLEDPYQLVEAGKWTVDKQFEMCTGIYSDLNGNGVKDIGDQYGQYTHTLHLDAFLWGSDIIILDTSGENPVFSESFLGEKTLGLQEKVRNFFFDTNDGYLLTADNSVYQYFGKGISLFWNDRCRQAITFAGQEISYGIIPIPKYDEDQKNYATLMGNPFTLYAIPMDSKTTDMAGAVIECMASESYRTISPALYEVSLKLKYSQDDIASKMFDLAKNSVVFDLGRIFYFNLGGPSGTWQTAITSGLSWTTTMRMQEKPWARQLDKLLNAFD